MTKSGVIRYVASLPVGEYRSVLGAIRRAWKVKQTGKPVTRLRRTIRQDARDAAWAAARKTLAPTIRQMQASACELLDRMIAVGKHEVSMVVKVTGLRSIRDEVRR